MAKLNDIAALIIRKKPAGEYLFFTPNSDGSYRINVISTLGTFYQGRRGLSLERVYSLLDRARKAGNRVVVADAPHGRDLVDGFLK